ncbi:MAG: hypothetical protein DRN19_04725 [Thermoplasmata archaeon]|nr:MAG: hypothetical protein DRN19_04725 [Thermoplasmata archaeon]
MSGGSMHNVMHSPDDMGFNLKHGEVGANLPDEDTDKLWKNSKEWFEKSVKELHSGAYDSALLSAFQAMSYAVKTILSKEGGVVDNPVALNLMFKKCAEEGRIDYEWFTLFNRMQYLCQRQPATSKEKAEMAIEAVKDFLNHVESLINKDKRWYRQKG